MVRAFFGFLMALTTAASAADLGIHYSLIADADHGDLRSLSVEMRFNADPDGLTELRLPDSYGGATALYDNLQFLAITGGDAVETPSPALRRIRSVAGAPLTVRYRFALDLAAGAYPSPDQGFAPALSPDYVHALGPTMFAFVDGRDREPADVAWSMPVDWTIASSVYPPPAGAVQDDIVGAVILAGKEVRTRVLPTARTDLTIAHLGSFDFDVDDFDLAVARIIGTEQAFWNDGQRRFLVTLSPFTVANGHSLQGTGLANAFDILTSPGIPASKLRITLAHEYFHSWNIVALGGPDATPAASAWFSEGVTDYYGRKLALRSGVIDLEGYVDDWNRALAGYAASPVRVIGNAELARDYWTNHDVSELAYSRGAVLAAWWNATLPRDGARLDALMGAMRAAAADPAYGRLGIVDRMIATGKSLGLDLAVDLRRYVVDGEPIRLPEMAFGGCLRLVDEPAAAFDPGFDGAASAAAQAFVGVRPGSAAYRAGLRDGMQRLAVLSGEPGNASVPMTMRVRDPASGEEKELSYLPAGERTFVRQRIVVPAGLSPTELDACTRAVAAF